jgi:hypothetical protein
MVLGMFGAGSWAGTEVPPAKSRKLAQVKMECSKQQAQPVCGCVTKNISSKVDRGQFNQEQLDDAVTVMKKLRFMGEIFVPRLESMADLLVGLEYHCQKNPNYSVN